VFEAADNRLIKPAHSILDVVRHRTFLAFWVRRNIMARYRQTSLGPLWALLLPILSGVVYGFVFGIFLGVKSGDVPYAVFATTNLVLWTYATRTILSAPTALFSNLDLITRVRFPREVLPIGVWLEALTDFGLSVLMAMVFFAIFDVPVTRYMLLVPVIFVVFSMLLLGFAFVVAAIAISVRDLVYVMPMVLQLALYLAPVVYPIGIVPPEYRELYLLNPVAVVFASFEETLFLGRFTLGTHLFVSGCVAVLMLWFGYRFFKRQEWKLADLL
jgi:lipopolysaccharide transport system permease protein